MQAFTLLAGLALATALWSGVQAINSEARASYDAAAATLGEGQFDQLRRTDGAPMTQATFVNLRRAGWQVSPVIEGRINGQRLIGLDPVTAPGALTPIPLDGTADLSAFLIGHGQVFGTLSSLEMLGDDVMSERIAVTDIAPNTILSDIGTVQRILGRDGEIDRLIVAPEVPIGRQELADIAPQLSRIAAQTGSDVAQLTDSFHLNLTAFGFLSFAVGIFIVNGAIGLAFEQRRGVIRTLRALGVPLSSVMIVMAIELLCFAVIAGGVGVVFGYLIASVLLPDVAATLRGLYGADVAGTLQLRPSWWLSSLVIAVGGTAIAAAGAFWKLAQLPLLAGANPRAMAMATRGRARWQTLAAMALFLLAVILAFSATGLATGFVMLGVLLIGAALILPTILDAALMGGQNASRSALTQWFWADTRQQLPGLSLALMALMLAIAANIGVSTMVSSFRLTFIDFLDQRLASELYLTVEDVEQVDGITAFLETRVDAILPIQSVERTLLGLPAEVYGARDHATQRDNWKFLSAAPDAWDQVHSGVGILINEQLANRTETAVGQIAALDGRDLIVAGIYGDYGNPIGQAIISEGVFGSLFPEKSATEFGIRVAPGKVAELVEALEATFDLSPNATINQAAIKELSLGIFERTFRVTGALNVLTLAVAGFAILMSLLTLASMRLPQLAPAWALGVTRRQIGWYEVLRALLLGALTFAIALPLGLVLAWVLLAVVNVAAFGWKLPMFIFPAEYLKLGGLSLIAALLAALWPALKLSRTPPAELLKVFAHER